MNVVFDVTNRIKSKLCNGNKKFEIGSKVTSM